MTITGKTVSSLVSALELWSWLQSAVQQYKCTLYFALLKRHAGRAVQHQYL